MRVQTKQHPGPPTVGTWTWGQQPYLIKIVLLQKHQGAYTTAWGVDGPLGQRPMTPGSESQVDLEAARPKWLHMGRTATTGPGL